MQTCSWHAFNLVCVGGVGCLRSVFCVLVSNIGFWRERGVYCRLHSQSTADTVPLPSLPVLCFVDRRDAEAAEAAGKIAKTWPFPEQKEKNFFHE